MIPYDIHLRLHPEYAGRCNQNYHTIAATAIPEQWVIFENIISLNKVQVICIASQTGLLCMDMMAWFTVCFRSVAYGWS
jgi:hypothetical protein